MTKKYDIIGLGNALVDFIVEVDDKVLNNLQLTKGQFHLATTEKSTEILEKLRFANAQIVPGGSAANAIATASLLGAKTAFISKIGNDEHGVLYENETRAAGVESKLTKCNSMTGHCIVLVTPDAERTFAVNLGASNEITEPDINEDDIAQSTIIHIDGYQLAELPELTQHAMHLAKRNNIKVSLDVSDPGVVERNKELFIQTVKDSVDIVFANELEAKALTGNEPEDALAELSEWCEVAVVKLGDKGSLISYHGELVMVDAFPAQAVDTTGAGDAYAAGILYGLTNGKTIHEAGIVASRLGAQVVSQIGARLDKTKIALVR